MTDAGWAGIPQLGVSSSSSSSSSYAAAGELLGAAGSWEQRDDDQIGSRDKLSCEIKAILL
jgi:hypothetical protein